MIEYTVILEPGPPNWSAYVPDLPGCVAAAETREETLDLIREALALHLAGLRERGQEVPPATSQAVRVTVPA
ncbi:MAG: type II toxin-antitoxin system HicB family antitoxin [Hyphomicrobiales bacterium]